RVVRERGRVEHDRGPVVGRLVDPSDQLRFVVGLAEVDLQAEFFPGRTARVSDVGQRGRAVYLWLTGPEAAEIRPVEHEYSGHRPDPPRYACASSSSGGSSGTPGLASPSSTISRSRSPRVFLSTAMVSRSRGQAPGW